MRGKRRSQGREPVLTDAPRTCCLGLQHLGGLEAFDFLFNGSRQPRIKSMERIRRLNGTLCWARIVYERLSRGMDAMPVFTVNIELVPDYVGPSLQILE